MVFFAMWGIMMIVMIVLLIGIYIATCFPLMKLFERAYVEPWKAWIPILNTWTMLELGGLHGWFALLAFVPIVGSFAGTIVMGLANYKFAQSFGRTQTFCIVSIFFALVTNWIMYLDKSCDYAGPQ